jgi:hypothetical protein
MFANLAPHTLTPDGEFRGATALVLLLAMVALICHVCEPRVTVPVPPERAESPGAVWADHYAAEHQVAPAQCRACYRSDHSHEAGHYAESGAPCDCACARRAVSA